MFDSRIVPRRQTRPVLTDDEFKKTEEVVAEFGQKGGIGQQLHAKLVEIKEKTDKHTWDSSEFQTWLVRSLPVVVCCCAPGDLCAECCKLFQN